jgi:hypothetical protein
MISRMRAGSSPAFQKVCHWLRGLKIRSPGPADHDVIAQQCADAPLQHVPVFVLAGVPVQRGGECAGGHGVLDERETLAGLLAVDHEADLDAAEEPRLAVVLATALGGGVSMAFSEGLSDTGELTGRGSPVLRGVITGGGAFVGGVFHTLPFLIPSYHAAVAAAIVIVAVELLLLGWLRHRFFNTSFVRSFVSVTVGGALIASLSAALGVVAAG